MRGRWSQGDRVKVLGSFSCLRHLTSIPSRDEMGTSSATPRSHQSKREPQEGAGLVGLFQPALWPGPGPSLSDAPKFPDLQSGSLGWSIQEA